MSTSRAGAVPYAYEGSVYRGVNRDTQSRGHAYWVSTHASTYVGAGDRIRTSRTFHQDEVAAAEAYDEKIRRAMGHPRFPASSAFQNRNVTYRQHYLIKINFPTIAEIKELLRGGHVHAQEQRERDAAVAANEHARRFAPTRVTNRDHTNLRVSRDSMKVSPVILHRSWYWYFRKAKNLTGEYSMYDRTRLCALHNARRGTEAPPELRSVKPTQELKAWLDDDEEG
ncbi:hypothetical protein RI054_44g153540 [Pseudoscourfieldia marina]